jgi:hypothetical protein
MCLVIGLFVGALLISQLSAKMVRVQTVNHDRLHQMDLLSRFFVEQGVPRMLAQRIRRQVRERHSNIKPLTLQDVPPLALLPTTLKQELASAIFARSFVRHSIFYMWSTMEDTVVEDMSARAIDLEAYSKHDDVFVPLSEAERVFFLRMGSLSYTREIFQLTSGGEVDGEDPKSFVMPTLASQLETPNDQQAPVEISPTSWISMVALWCRWTYVGTLRALDNCELVVFNVAAMTDVLARYPQLFRVNKAYAKAYAMLLVDTEHSTHVDLDIPAPHVLMSMPRDDRTGFSNNTMDSFGAYTLALERYYPIRRVALPQAEQEKLAAEVEAGKCVVTVGADCQLLRSVLLCVLHITNTSGESLVKIATSKKEGLVPDVVLPGSKLRGQESARETAERIIKTELPEIRGTLVFECNTDEVQVQKSKSFSIRTAYYKTRIHISVESGDSDDHGDSGSEGSICEVPAEVSARKIFKKSPTGVLMFGSASKSLTSNNLDAAVDISAGLCQRLQAMEVLLPDGNLELYAWLTTSDFQELSQSSREEELKYWLAHYKKRSVRRSVHRSGSSSADLVSSSAQSLGDDLTSSAQSLGAAATAAPLQVDEDVDQAEIPFEEAVCHASF